MNKSNLLAEYENDSVTGVAEHGVMLCTDRETIIIGNAKWKWRRRAMIFRLDDSLAENNSLNLRIIVDSDP